MEEIFLDTMDKIITAIKKAGYDPYSQLAAFLMTHDERYITRSGSARQMVCRLDFDKLMLYVNEMEYEQDL